MSWRVLQGDALERLRGLASGSVQCCVTSPPFYGLRDYGTGEWEGGESECDHRGPPKQSRSSTLAGNGHGGDKPLSPSLQAQSEPVGRVCGKCGARRVDRQLGLEPTPDEYVARLVEVFREVRRVLRDDGTLWLNLGSSYVSGGMQPSQPHRDAPACGSDGKGQAGSLKPDCVYPDLCDECRDATRTRHDRIAGSDPPAELAVPLSSPITRDNELAGSGSTPSDVLPHAVQESTSSQSSGPPLAVCSHCSNCGACLAVLRSSSRDARLCARRAERMTGSASLASDGRNRDTDAAGMAWLNYTRRLKPKDLLPVPWMVAMALQADGWYLRSDVIWAKPNPMPESVTDRPTSAHEHVFLLAKSRTYLYDADAIREPGVSPEQTAHNERYAHEYVAHTERVRVGVGIQPGSNGNLGIHARPGPGGRNRRNVWEIATQPYPEAHFATFPTKLVEPMVLAGSSPKACGVCGAPWKRVVERTAAQVTRKTYNAALAGAVDRHRGLPERPGGFEFGDSRTTGWQSSCSHNDDTGRCVVLDPFAGSGTVGVVARWHGRDFVGIELNAEYVGMAERRIASEGVLGRRPRRDCRDDGHPSLFDDGEGLVLGAG